MELIMTCIYKILNPAPHLLARTTTGHMSSIKWNLLRKTTWKSPGGILVFRVLVQFWLEAASVITTVSMLHSC